MEEKEVVQLLQLYRHNLMNELQVIQGYLSMDMIDKVKDKVNDTIDYYNEERKLINLQIPNFILWVLTMDNLRGNIQFFYQINNIKGNLTPIDKHLVEQCQHIINWINKFGNKQELHEVKLRLDQRKENMIGLIVSINSKIENKEYLKDKLLNVKFASKCRIEDTDIGVVCKCIYLIEE